MKKAIVLMTVVLTPLFALAQNTRQVRFIETNGKQTDTVYQDVPEEMAASAGMPVFPGDMQEFMRDNLRYPADAKVKNISGVVQVGFMVDTSGRLHNIHVTKRLRPSLDREAVRLVKLMPPWYPAVRNSKKVAAYWEIQVPFNKESD